MSKMKYIVMLNDGTDEIFNMHSIEAETLKDALEQINEFFGEDFHSDPDEEYSEAERNGTDRFFIEMDDKKEFDRLMECSDMDEDDSAGWGLLMAFYKHVIEDNCIKVEGNGKYWGRESLERMFKDE